MPPGIRILSVTRCRIQQSAHLPDAGWGMQFQDAVGNIAKGFGALQQGVFGGGQRREGQPTSAAAQV